MTKNSTVSNFWAGSRLEYEAWIRLCDSNPSSSQSRLLPARQIKKSLKRSAIIVAKSRKIRCGSVVTYARQYLRLFDF